MTTRFLVPNTAPSTADQQIAAMKHSAIMSLSARADNVDAVIIRGYASSTPSSTTCRKSDTDLGRELIKFEKIENTKC